MTQAQQLLDIIFRSMDATGLRRTGSMDRRYRFGRDVALVALSVRCGCLVDAISVDSSRLASLIRDLHRSHAVFLPLILVCESSSGQMFIVNRKILTVQTQDSSWTTFLEIAFIELIPPPETACCLVKQIKSCPDEAIEVQLQLESLPSTVLVALAGFLLEYRIAYAVPPDQDVFLSNVPLDVYECIVRYPTPGETTDASTSHLSARVLRPFKEGSTAHTLLKFSCPVVVGESHDDYAPKALLGALYARFQPRLAIHGLDMQVQHTTVTLDRVAL